MPDSNLIIKRLRLAREEAEMTQEELSKAMGFKDRQTLAAIEAGQRKLNAEELTNVIQIFNKPLEFFTDPYLVSKKDGSFYWRAKASNSALSDFESKILRIIAAYKRFGELLGKPHLPLEQGIPVRKSDSFEKASQIAKGFVEKWKLGDIPAKKFPDVLEEKFSFLVLGIRAPNNISGAFCRFPEINTLVTNINEKPYRQNFNIAHELFHALTWQTIPPQEIENPFVDCEHYRPRSEQLANAFASSMLLPEKSILGRWKKRENISIAKWISKIAKEFSVSADAVYWRLVNLNLIKKEDVEIKQLKDPEKNAGEKQKYLLFSKAFVNKLYEVLNNGLVSVRKATELLDLTVEELAALFKTYNKPVPFKI